MRPALLADTLKARVKTHIDGTIIRPTNIIGPPGIGKTAIPKQVAKDLDLGFMSIHGPLMLAEDFGMPRVDQEAQSLEFLVPLHKFPFEGTDCPDTGMIVVDELAQMDAPQQKIIANMFQERELHGRKLKPGWHFVATGNRQQDRAGANRILSHLNDRITTYELEVSHEDWSRWALTEGGVRPEVVAFLNFRSDLLHKFDPAHDKNPTPRSWAEGVSRSIDTIPAGAEMETFRGDVGEGAGTEFTAFLQTFRELPDPDAVLARPDKAAIPDKLNVLYALCGALSHRANPDNMEALVTYAERLHDADRQEFMVLVIRDATRANPAVMETKAFIRWATTKGFDTLT